MARRPNILWILSDQHSPHLAGFAGSRQVETPHLDALAARGTRFDAAYCQAPLCVPSRMSMLCGKRASHCGAWDNGSALSAEHAALPAWLARHGYATAAVGKLHFRGPEREHGFQHRPYGDLLDSAFAGHQPDPPETADGRWNDHAVGRFPFAGPTHLPESLLADGVVTRESLAWLLDFDDREPDTPWFFLASYPRPHFPLTAPARFVRRVLRRGVELPELPDGYPESLHPHDRFIVVDFGLAGFSRAEQERALAAYLASVEYLDTCIGELLDGLERAGLLAETHVVYTSDHGELAGEHGLWWKRSYYEASSRVPLLVAGPGLPQGHSEATPVELVDLYPTFCHWAGVPPPSELDGESLMPLLAGGSRSKAWAVSELLGGRPETRFRMLREGRWKAVDFPTAPPRLFDLEADPGESCDLAADPPLEARLDELLHRLAASGAWSELEARRQADRERAGPLGPQVASAVQYRLADGRLLDLDGALYEPWREET